jgi:cathepsin D
VPLKGLNNMSLKKGMLQDLSISCPDTTKMEVVDYSDNLMPTHILEVSLSYNRDLVYLPISAGGPAGSKPARLTPTPTPAPTPTTINGVVVGDDIEGDSEYLFSITVGTPGAKYLVDGDTGSSDLWLLGSKTKTSKAYPRIYYNPTSSTDSTAKALGATYTWSIEYGDGSYASGSVYQDTVNVGGIPVKSQAVEQAVRASSTFVNYIGDGLIVSLARL